MVVLAYRRLGDQHEPFPRQVADLACVVENVARHAPDIYEQRLLDGLPAFGEEPQLALALGPEIEPRSLSACLVRCRR